MEKELEQFCEEARRLRAGRQSGSLPFPEAMRAFAVRYLEHTVAAGGTVRGACEKLGVSEPTLQAWRKGRPASKTRPAVATPGAAALVPVRVTGAQPVTPSAPESRVVLVSPAGWRVAGLTVESAAQLLRSLTC